MRRWLSIVAPAVVLALYYLSLSQRPATASSRELTRALVEQIGEALHDQRYDDALPLLLRLSRAYPKSHVYAGQLASVYEQLHLPNEEAAVWERYVELSPSPFEACPRIGLAYREQGRMAESVRAFERCLGFAPKDSDMLVFLGLAYERSGDDVRADELFVRTLAVAPNYSDAALGRGRVALRRGEPAAALAIARDVLARGADNADALFVAGLAAFRLDDRAAARGYLEHALRQRDDSDVRLVLGMLAESDRKRDEALVHYAAALKLNPDNRDAQTRKARLEHVR